MNMILKTAVASAIAVSAVGTSQALGIATYAGNSATNVNVYVSGSTAVDNTLINTAILSAAPGGLCQAGTIDVYQIGGSQTMIYCSASNTSGATAGTPLAIFKESAVGSANGVSPLINAAKNAASGTFFISPAALVTAGGDAACTTSSVAATTVLNAYTKHASCTSTAVTAATVIPTGGIADVEARLLRLRNNATISNSDVSNLLTSQNIFDVVWGVPVTKGLYRALQAKEGLTPDDNPANAPSLSRQVIASLYAGNVFNWSQLGLTNSTDANVYVCRRDIQSGTQASFEAYFMGARCSSASTAVAKQDGQFVFSMSSGGNMRGCLKALDQGGTITPYNGDFNGDAFTPVTIPAPGGRWGIGILSSEVTADNLTGTTGSGAADSFRFIAVDGVLPTLPNVVNGNYKYWSSNFSYQIKAGQPNAPTGSALAVWNTLSSRMGDPVPTSETNTAYAGRPWGNGGDLSPANQFVTSATTVTIPATTASTTSSPINAMTKASGGAANNCDTPVSYSGVAGAIQQSIPVQNRLLGTGNVNN